MFKLFQKYPKLVAAVSEKEDGSMKLAQDSKENHDILENTRAFLEKEKISPADLVKASLCHGKEVRLVSTKEKGTIIENTDSLFTKEKGIFLSVTVADCLPLFLFDLKNEHLSLVHAGWRGLENGIIAETIKKMRSAGSDPKNILAVIGPSIGKCHYEVGKDVQRAFSRFREEVSTEKEGKTFLDLKRIAQLQLIENGILPRNIEISKECTFCEKEKYFSFRRDCKGDVSKLEAMMAVMGIKN